MGFGASLPLLQHSLNGVRKWDTRKGCVCAPLFSCHQHSFGKVFPPPALFVFVYSKLCLDLSFVFQTIKMCVCESFHLCLWIFTFVFVNLYICVCESLSLQEPSPYFNFIGAALSSMNGDAAKTRQNNFLAIATSTPLHNLSHSHLQGCLLKEDLVQMISSSCHHGPHQVSFARESRINFKSLYNV